MALIRVTCPTCRAELELDARHAGQEVECGSCLQVFVAERPAGERQPAPAEPRRPRPAEEDDRRRRPHRDEEDDRPRRRRREEYDYEEDDGYEYSLRSNGGGTGLAVTSLILGIVTIPLVGCCGLVFLQFSVCSGLFSLPFSIGGAVCGLIGMRQEEGKGMAIAGLVLNMIAVVLAVIMAFIGIVIMGNLNQGGP